MHSPNPMGLSPHWGHTHIIPSMCPYPHLNHLLPTQHMLHNNVIGAPRGLHGLSNPVMSGIGSFHPNGVSPSFSGIHGLNTNSLTDSKESSSEWFADLCLRIVSFLFLFFLRRIVQFYEKLSYQSDFFDFQLRIERCSIEHCFFLRQLYSYTHYLFKIIYPTRYFAIDTSTVIRPPALLCITYFSCLSIVHPIYSDINVMH